MHTYLDPGSVLTSDIVGLAQRQDTIALVNWRPVQTWADATGGNATVNRQIDAMADSIKALGATKIMLAIHHEPENDISPGGDPNCPTLDYKGTAGKASDYVAMWRNIRHRFEARGVTNVVWVMNYMGWKGWNCVVKDLWPGNDYVDWVTWDPYPRNADWSGKIGEFYSYLTTSSDADHDFLSKPWGLSEFAYAGDNQTQAYQLYDRARQGVHDGLFPKLKAFVVWDSHTSSSFDDRVLYTHEGVKDQVEQDHYNAFVNDPLLEGSATPDPPPDPPVTPDTVLPTVTLTAPTGSEPIRGQVDVSGTATDDTAVTSAQLLVDGSPAGAATVDPGGAVSVSWETDAVENGPHTLQLSANDAAGNTGLSLQVPVQVDNSLDDTPPTAPGDLTAVASGPDAVLSWSAASDDRAVTSYLVYRDGQPDPIETLDATARTYRDTGLPDTTDHTYSVVAIDMAGNVSEPAESNQVHIGDNTPPDPPVVSAQLVGDVGADVGWTPVDASDVTGYEVYRNGTLVSTMDSTVTSYDDAGLADGRTFGYTVRAVDGDNNKSVSSNEAQVTTNDLTPPGAPTKLTGSVSGSTVRLTWTAASDNVAISSYTVYRNGTPIGSSTSAAFTDPSPLRTGTARYFVAAVDTSAHQGPASNTANVTFADKTAPTAPSTLKAVAGVKNVTLTWKAATDNVGVARYYLYRGNAKYKQLGLSTRYTDTGLTTGTTYAYRLFAIDAAGNWSSSSNLVSARPK